MNSNKIGKFIYQLRTEKNLSQYQLADLIPITRQAVSKWERGITIPDSSTLLRLSDIFEVSINELLNGERLNSNSIQQLENTTLNILDESNKKSKKLKRNFIKSTIVIGILLLSFLTYYFINSYNSIKLYSVYAEGKNFFIYDGLFITTKEKSYFKIGKVQSAKDLEINRIRVYYKEGNKKKYISTDTDLDREIVDYSGYSIFSLSKINKKSLEGMYLEIKYNKTKTENVLLKFKKDFANNNLFFQFKPKYKDEEEKKKDVEEITMEKPQEEKKEEENREEVKEKIESPIINNKKEIEENKEETKEEPTKEVFQEEQEIEKEEKKEEEIVTITENDMIDIMKQKGIPNNGNYVIEKQVGDNNVRVVLFPTMNQLIMYENDEIVWTFFPLIKISNCESSSDKNIDTSNKEECKKYVLTSFQNIINS